MKRWICTVCKYVHEGDEPPDPCPVCKVPKDKFVELDEDGIPIRPVHPKGSVVRTKEAEPRGGSFAQLMSRYHAHPMTVHVPNGVIPLSVAFVFAAFFLNVAGLAQAAFYNNLGVVISMPVVLFSGYMSWLSKYGGVVTSRFVTKIVSSTVATLAAVVLVLWYYWDPHVLSSSSGHSWLFLMVNIIVLIATSIAGFVGGKLVFKD
jgi:uncharacterized membrane protein